MIENINIILFLILASMCYVFLALFAAINIIDAVGNYYSTLKSRIKHKIKASKAKNLVIILKNRVYLAISVILKVLFGYLMFLSESFNSFEELLNRSTKFVFEESLEYSSLTIRKTYEGSIRSIILYGTAVIVVFYIILSIF